MEVLVYVGSLESKMRYPFDFKGRVRCPRGRGEGVIVFETDLAFDVAQ